MKNLPEAYFSCSNCYAPDTFLLISPLLVSLTATPSSGTSFWELNGQPLPALTGLDSVSIFMNPADSLAEICLERFDSLTACSNRFCRSLRLLVVNPTKGLLPKSALRLFYGEDAQVYAESATEAEAELRDLQGRLIRGFSIRQGQNQLSFPGMPVGFYVLKIKLSSGEAKAFPLFFGRR
jgi:hypothetical protein